MLLRIGEDLQASFPFAPENARFIGKTHRTSTFPQASLSFMSFANAQLTNVGREGDWSEIVYDLVPDPFAPTLWQLVRRVRLNESQSLLALNQMRKFCHSSRAYKVSVFASLMDGHGLKNGDKTRPEGAFHKLLKSKLYLQWQKSLESTDNEQLEDVTFSTLVDLPLARPVGAAGRVGGNS